MKRDLIIVNSDVGSEQGNKFIQELNDNKEQLLLNAELMDLQTYAETALGKHTQVVDDIIGNYI